MEIKLGDKLSRDQACKFALDLAQKGKGLVEPNPCVGALVVDEESGELLSFGYHKKFGEAHAEVEALKNLKVTEGKTLIVTLEPCSHYGKTPPCSDLVIEKKIKKVIYFDKDPNPLVSGKGLEKLRECGVEVVQAPEKYSLANQKINEAFFCAFEKKRAFVHLKWAQSIDGKMSLHGKSKWITSKALREKGHFLRAQSSAILVGRETLERDDPQLNIRLAGYEKGLKIIIFDPELKSLPGLSKKKIYKIHGPKNIIFVTNKKTDQVQTLVFDPFGPGLLTRELYSKYKVHSLYVEGGAKTLSYFVKNNFYDRISIFIGNKIIGQDGLGLGDYIQVKDVDTFLSLENSKIDYYVDSDLSHI